MPQTPIDDLNLKSAYSKTCSFSEKRAQGDKQRQARKQKIYTKYNV